MCVLNTHTHPRTPSISWQRFHFSYLIKVDGKSFKLSIKKNNTKSCHKSRRKAEPIYLSVQQGRQRKQVEEGEEGKQGGGKRKKHEWKQANADLQRIEMEKFN